ncbi:MAG: aminotransferase class I/II-fold pyridoxal phosphate-dependent enzyme, partial [Bacteroidota bacterium]
ALASEVEAIIADYLHAESALLFPTGYQANLGLLSSIATRHDTILYDALVHASIRDGLRLSAARCISFAHNNLDDLQAKLSRAAEAAWENDGRVFVVSESVFSMDGDQAPIQSLSTLALKHDAHLIIDEAHALGVLGPGGRGKVVEAGLEAQVFARVVTFGKALGAQGAAVLGREALKQLLLNTARSQIYTTALSPLVLQLLKAGFQRLPGCEQEREHVQALVRTFIVETAAISSSVLAQEGPMLAVIVPGNAAVQRAAEQLQTKGFDVRPIRSPTVAKGSERLRICLHSYNTKDDVRQLVSAIKKLLQD